MCRQLGLEEGHYGGVDLTMERRAVKPCGIAADLRRHRRKRWRARRQECEVAGVWHHMIFGLYRQPVINALGVVGMRKNFVAVATPKLDRHRDAGKRLGRERVTYRRRRDHSGDDAGIVYPVRYGHRLARYIGRYVDFAL